MLLYKKMRELYGILYNFMSESYGVFYNFMSELYDFLLSCYSKKGEKVVVLAFLTC